MIFVILLIIQLFNVMFIPFNVWGTAFKVCGWGEG